MKYTAILMDGRANTTTFEFDGSQDREEAFKSFDEAYPSMGYVDHYLLIAIIPGVHEVHSRFGSHVMPHEKIDLNSEDPFGCNDESDFAVS